MFGQFNDGKMDVFKENLLIQLYKILVSKFCTLRVFKFDVNIIR